MITRWYEIVCDDCGSGEHFLGNIQSAESQFRNTGGIVTKDKKHYCDKNCYDHRNTEGD